MVDINNNYPSRLVVPMTNFKAAFPKVSYMGTKRIFDEKNKINYSKKISIQSSKYKNVSEN